MTPPPPPASGSTPPPLTPAQFAGRHIYMVGIGGCGMAGLARMLATLGGGGGLVSGSDMTPSEATTLLERDGIPVGFDQTKHWLPQACDLVIASAAIKPDHPQVLEANRRGIQVLFYAEAL